MDYIRNLRKRASDDTWELIIESPFVTALVAILIFALTVLFTYLVKGGESMRDLLLDSGIGFAAMATAFSLIYALHFLYLSPRRLWIESQGDILKKNKDLEEWRALFEPKLTVRCGSQIPGSKVVEDNGVDFNQVFRAEVTAFGFNPIQNCQGTLLRVERNGEELWATNPAPLTFSRADKPDSVCKKIDLSGPQYLEVVGIIKRENGFRNWENCVRLAINTHQRELSPSFQSKFSQFGDYLIVIAVSGHSTVPIGAELRFVWTGEYDTSSLTLIKQFSMGPTPPSSAPNKSTSQP